MEEKFVTRDEFQPLSLASLIHTDKAKYPAEFENVLVVFGRGWNQYNFGQVLEWTGNKIPAGKQDTYERNRNLFYVAYPRPKKRLTILFTQSISDHTLATLLNCIFKNVMMLAGGHMVFCLEGASSIGKTTLSHALSQSLGLQVVPEFNKLFARPAPEPFFGISNVR